MQLFECQNCGQLLYFENTRCVPPRPPPGLVGSKRPRLGGRWLVATSRGRRPAELVLRQRRPPSLQLAGVGRKIEDFV